MPLLLADIGDVIGALVPFVIFVIWILGQVLRGFGAKGDRPAGKPAATLVEQKVDVFLRQAEQHREAVGPGHSPRRPLHDEAPVDVEVLEEVFDDGSVASHVEQHINISKFDRRTAELDLQTGQADEKLKSRLHEKFDRHIGQLTSGGRSDDPQAQSVESVSRENFEPYEDQPKVVPVVDMANLVDSLRNPQSLKQAIILREILDRPEHRWS